LDWLGSLAVNGSAQGDIEQIQARIAEVWVSCENKLYGYKV